MIVEPFHEWHLYVRLHQIVSQDLSNCSNYISCLFFLIGIRSNNCKQKHQTNKSNLSSSHSFISLSPSLPGLELIFSDWCRNNHSRTTPATSNQGNYMMIISNSHQIPLNLKIIASMHRRLRLAPGRFDNTINKIRIPLSDINGPKGAQGFSLM